MLQREELRYLFHSSISSDINCLGLDVDPTLFSEGI